MKNFVKVSVIIFSLLIFNIPAEAFSNKPSPDEAIQMLKEGNKRFVQGKSMHPNLNFSRIRQAGNENQGEHAYTTIVACSDSRVPVELLFDAGIMDIFVIRVAGNVCGINEAGSIEYGLAHVRTPVLLVLGHTQCGAVTAVTNALQEETHSHSFEGNIHHLVSDIKPAVKRALKDHPEMHGDQIIPFGIEENVLESIENLFMMSPVARNMVKQGVVKVVGAVYDVSTGRVRWMPDSSVDRILAKVESSPNRIVSTRALKLHESSAKKSPAKHEDVKQEIAHKSLDTHRLGHINLVEKSKFLGLLKARNRKVADQEITLPVETEGLTLTTKILIMFIIIFSFIGIAFRTIIIGRVGVRNELYLAFFITIVTSLFVALCANYMLYTTEKESDIALASLNLDILSNEMHRLQEEFLLKGLENKTTKERIIAEHKNISLAYRKGLEELLQFDMDSIELQSINTIQNKMLAYSKSFLDLTNKYQEIEFLKDELEQLSNTIDQKLKTLVTRHEEYLAGIKPTSKANSAKRVIHTKLVEELIKAEMLTFKVAREETEFLVDKHFDRIDALEEEIGELHKSLDIVESLVPLLKTSKLDKQADLATIGEIKGLIASYVQDISKIIMAEMVVGADLVDCEENLKIIEANFSALGQRAQKIVAKTKSEYHTVLIFLMCIYVFGGAYLAFVQTREIVTPINKANEMMDKMRHGDFSQRLNLKRKDEIGILAKSLDSLADKLKDLIAKK